MRIREVFTPNPSTLSLANQVFNLLYRVLLISFAAIFLGASAVALGQLALLGAQATGFNEEIQAYLKAGAQMLYLILVVSTWFYAAVDPLRLLLIYLTNRESQDDHNPTSEP